MMPARLRHFPDHHFEQEYWEKGFLVAGVDEAGRGALAGPVVAASVIFPKGTENTLQCRDSKIISANEREEIFEGILS